MSLARQRDRFHQAVKGFDPSDEDRVVELEEATADYLQTSLDYSKAVIAPHVLAAVKRDIQELRG